MRILLHMASVLLIAVLALVGLASGHINVYPRGNQPAKTIRLKNPLVGIGLRKLLPAGCGMDCLGLENATRKELYNLPPEFYRECSRKQFMDILQQHTLGVLNQLKQKQLEALEPLLARLCLTPAGLEALQPRLLSHFDPWNVLSSVRLDREQIMHLFHLDSLDQVNAFYLSICCRADLTPLVIAETIALNLKGLGHGRDSVPPRFALRVSSFLDAYRRHRELANKEEASASYNKCSGVRQTKKRRSQEMVFSKAEREAKGARDAKDTKDAKKAKERDILKE